MMNLASLVMKVVPAQPSGSEVGESLEEHEYSDDADYHQLLKDYRKV